MGKGGLGVRHAVDLALPAFLASVESVRDLVKNILPHELQANDATTEDGQQLWKAITNAETPNGASTSQRAWETPILQNKVDLLFASATTPQEKARLFGVSGTESGAWLNAVPAAHMGTLLDNDAFRVSVALRLGAPVCHPHICRCGADVDILGRHGLSCRFGAGRRSRDAEVNDLLRRTLASGGIPAVLEPSGTSRDDGKRPDGVTMTPGAKGKSLVWDYTCVDTFDLHVYPCRQ